MKSTWTAAIVLLLAVGLAGCQQGNSKSQASGDAAPSAERGTFLLSEEPQGARHVIEAREATSDGEDVVVVGRIGGGTNPWIEGRAAFSIVDGSLKACSDIPGDQCPTPWDYCCATDKLPTSTALVKVVDDQGQLVQGDAKTLLNVEELATVVVKGKAQRDDEGNLTVLANGVFVKK